MRRGSIAWTGITTTRAFFKDSRLKHGAERIFSAAMLDFVRAVEGSLPHLVDYLGANKILWATDYPHPDGFFRERRR